jgi:hypothetical protein
MLLDNTKGLKKRSEIQIKKRQEELKMKEVEYLVKLSIMKEKVNSRPLLMEQDRMSKSKDVDDGSNKLHGELI